MGMWRSGLHRLVNDMNISVVTGKIVNWPRQTKKCLRAYAKKKLRVHINLHKRKVSSGHGTPLKPSIVSNDSVCGQWMAWSECADAQAGLGLRFQHMSEDTFSHDTAHISYVHLMFRHYNLHGRLSPHHYENKPIQIRRKFHLQKLKIFRWKTLIFSYFCSKHRLWVLVRTASARRF